MGPENTGLFGLFMTRRGGYYVGALIISTKTSARASSSYVEQGTSRLIIDGHIKLKHGGSTVRFTPHGMEFDDGNELEADVVILATG